MNKIEALEKTIYNLENNVVKYDWHDTTTCNCGVVGATLMGITKENQETEMKKAGVLNSPMEDPKRRGVFADNAYCLTTNLPLPKVFQELKDAGFTHQELLELEYLGNKQIVDRMGETVWINPTNSVSQIDNCAYTLKEKLVAYLKSWVSILKEQEPKAEKIEVQYVSIDSIILKQAQELNYN